MNQPISQEEKWRKKFKFFWGLAPEGSAKHKRGIEVEEFISTVLSTTRQEAIRETMKKVLDIIEEEESRKYESHNILNGLKATLSVGQILPEDPI